MQLYCCVLYVLLALKITGFLKFLLKEKFVQRFFHVFSGTYENYCAAIDACVNFVNHKLVFR